jgi:hypothetical protein
LPEEKSGGVFVVVLFQFQHCCFEKKLDVCDMEMVR